MKKVESHTKDKDPKPPRLTQPQVVTIDILGGGVPVLPHGAGIVGRQQHKGEHPRDVEGEPRAQDAEPRVERVLVQRAAAGHEPAARGLQHEGGEVAEDKCDGVGARLEARVGGPEDGDDAREAEVQGGAEEGRADGDGYDVPVEYG